MVPSGRGRAPGPEARDGDAPADEALAWREGGEKRREAAAAAPGAGRRPRPREGAWARQAGSTDAAAAAARQLSSTC